MRKIFRAYKAAWRWPEVDNNPPTLVWLSRAIIFLLPLALVAAVVLSGIAVIGIGQALVASIAILVLFVIVTTTSFHEEYPVVVEYESHEQRIKTFFHGYPDYTDIPVIENDTGEWVAYGHIDPAKFVHAIHDVVLAVSDNKDLAEPYLELEPFVEHNYAMFKNPEENHWNEGILICGSADSTRCFPVTRVYL